MQNVFQKTSTYIPAYRSERSAMTIVYVCEQGSGETVQIFSHWPMCDETSDQVNTFLGPMGNYSLKNGSIILSRSFYWYRQL